MKSYFFTLLFALTIISCSSDDDTAVDCSLFDPGPQNILVNLIDNKGENLILDGSYDPAEIEVTANGEVAGSAIILDGDPRAFIYVNKQIAVNQTEMKYLIKLNAEETDTLKASYSIKNVECGHRIYTAEEILYNDVEMEIVLENHGQEIFVKKSRQ